MLSLCVCDVDEIVQTGTSDFNLTLIGNAWWAIGGGPTSTDFTKPNGNGSVYTGMIEATQVMAIGNIVDNWGGGAGNPWMNGTVGVPDIAAMDQRSQAFRVATGLDMFTRLGIVDLAVNYP